MKSPIFPNLDHRADMPEMMDSPDSDQRKLEKTLYLFGVVNRCVARVRHVLKRHVINVMRQNPQQEYHLIDLGAGACETDVWLLERCRRENLKLRISACDHDPRVVRHAQNRFGDLPGLDILQRDVQELGDLKPVHFIFANHLLHHLSDRQIVELLECLAEFEDATILINDLIRSRVAYLGYYAASLFFPRRSFTRYDGLVSIMKGFRPPEIRGYIEEATPDCQSFYKITKLFPYRLIIIREPLTPSLINSRSQCGADVRPACAGHGRQAEGMPLYKQIFIEPRSFDEYLLRKKNAKSYLYSKKALCSQVSCGSLLNALLCSRNVVP